MQEILIFNHTSWNSNVVLLILESDRHVRSFHAIVFQVWHIETIGIDKEIMKMQFNYNFEGVSF